ncbi:MAG: hypothetical protein AB1560_11265 [Pseudomonadota bacterium]
MDAMKIMWLIIPAVIFSQLPGCATDIRPNRPSLDLSLPSKQEILNQVTRFPPNLPKEYLVASIPSILRNINESRREDLSSVYTSFRVLSEQQNIVSAIELYYLNLPESRYAERLLSVKLLGALKRADALPLMRTIVEAPERHAGSLGESREREYSDEAIIRKRAIRGIAYLQTAEADKELIRLMTAHPSLEIRKEALWSFLWNKNYSEKAVATVRNVLPAGMWRWIFLQRFHHGMDPVAFDKAVRKWRADWAQVIDRDFPVRKDSVSRLRIGADARCNRDVLTSDIDVFAIASQVAGFRKWFAHKTAFNLPKDDWISRWGFRQTNDPDVIYPFNKMLTASFLLAYGIERQVLPSMEAVSSLGFWTGRNVARDLDEMLWDMFPGVSVVTSDDGVIHVFGRRVLATGNDLLHFSWSAAHGWAAENIDAMVSVTATQTFAFRDKPTAFIEDDGTIHVFVTQANELLRYYKTPGGSWAGENVTRDRLSGSVPFEGAPFVVRAPFSEDGSVSAMQPTLHVFGIDRLSSSSNNPSRLVNYRFASDGTWRANTVLSGSAPWTINITGANKFLYDTFYVIAKSDVGPVAYKWKPGGWAIDWLPSARTDYLYEFQSYWNYRIVGPGEGGRGIVLWSRGYGPNASWSVETLFPDRDFWAVVGTETYDSQTSYPRLHLFATNFNAELIHFWRNLEAGEWHEENLSQRHGHRMWIPTVASGPENTIHVFGESNTFLVHYYWSEERGWRGDNFGNRGRISSDPVVVTSAGNDLHVLSIDDNWDLIHFSQLDEPRALPWHPNDMYSSQTQGADLYKYVPREVVPEGVAASQGGLFATDQVEMSCLSFENHPEYVGSTGTANRAGVMVHESVHQRYADPVFGLGMPHDAEGDDWFAHGVHTGQHWIGVHSAIQKQAEYLSDVGEFPNYWVPFSVYGASCDEANELIEKAIKPNQDPGWRCGDLRPFP